MRRLGFRPAAPLPKRRLHIRDHGLSLGIFRIDQDRKARVSVQELLQKPELLYRKPRIHGGDAGDVAARSVEADDKAIRNWVTPSHEHDRHRRGRGFGSEGRGYAAGCRDDGHLPAY